MTKSERYKIKLSDRYYFTRDPHNYNLIEKRITKKGNTTEVVLGHFWSLGRLVNTLLENEIKTSKTDDLKALYRKLIEVEREITTNLEKAVSEYEQMRRL